jgi:hypothetical protein
MRWPAVNPVYAVESVTATSSTLIRRVGEPFVGRRGFNDIDLLPAEVTISAPSPDRAGLLALQTAATATFLDLVRRFVVLDAPEHFV